MAYSLSPKSIARLSDVHPDLRELVELAIAQTEQDFIVLEGLRSAETQAEYLKRGVTKTLKSKHLKQPSGYGHAVDLVPYVNGSPRWEWPLIYPVAVAMLKACRWKNVPVRWGGVWDKPLMDLPDTVEGMKKAVADYCVRHPGPDFLDGPHYELMR